MKRGIAGIVLLVGVFVSAAAVAGRPADPAMTAKLLSDLLVAERAVLASKQALINDAGKGDKGFTPEVFAEAAAAEFKTRSGLDLKALKPKAEADKLLLELFEASKETVAEAQPVINRAGMGFKGFTPAVFGFRAAERFLQKSGVRIKQTSAKYRNAANRPDEFEARVLEKFAGAGWKKGEGFGEAAEVNGAKAYRYMAPVYIAASCLTCHGDPKGELDVAGRAKEGYKEGELRGAISIVLPVK